jgi:hypothetical protein
MLARLARPREHRMSKRRRVEAPPSEPFCVDGVNFGPIRQLVEALLAACQEYEHFAVNFPEDQRATASLFGEVVSAQTRLGVALEKTGLSGSLRGSSMNSGDKMTAISLLKEADAEMTQQVASTMGPETIEIADKKGKIRHYPVLSCFAKGRPLRFQPRSVEKVRTAVEILQEAVRRASSKATKETPRQPASCRQVPSRARAISAAEVAHPG